MKKLIKNFCQNEIKQFTQKPKRGTKKTPEEI